MKIARTSTATAFVFLLSHTILPTARAFTQSPKQLAVISSRKGFSAAASTLTTMNATTASKVTVSKYLDRIGIQTETADAIVGRKPNESDLGLLLRAHLLSVPFENLSQHVHPSIAIGIDTKQDGYDANAKQQPTPPTSLPIPIPIVEIPISNLPTLDVDVTLQKIVIDHRGGFCWEINFAFAWLLRQLGYKVRLGSANVLTPDGPILGHLCLYVDALRDDGVALHVDPGFGDAPRAPMPAIFGNTIADPMIGDEHHFVPNHDDSDTNTNTKKFHQSSHHLERFDAVLMRSRNDGGIGGSALDDVAGMNETLPPPLDQIQEAVYLLNFDDDLEGNCEEFQEGLAAVLSPNSDTNLFAKKRMCIINRETGFDYVGNKYWKKVRNGSEVHRETLDDERAYREALEKVAGIRL